MRSTLRSNDNDDRPCALVFRRHVEDAWELHCYTLSISVAWRSADMLLHAFKLEGVEEVQIAVMLRALYDDNRGTPLAPPSGFEYLKLDLPKTSQRVEKPLCEAKVLPAVEDDVLGAIDKDMDF